MCRFSSSCDAFARDFSPWRRALAASIRFCTFAFASPERLDVHRLPNVNDQWRAGSCLKAARSSAVNSSGCSHAAKCPPLGSRL